MSLVFKYYYHIIGQCQLETSMFLISTDQNEAPNKSIDYFFFFFETVTFFFH